MILLDDEYYIDYDNRQFIVGELRYKRTKEELRLVKRKNTERYFSIDFDTEDGYIKAIKKVTFWLLHNRMLKYDHTIHDKNNKITNNRNITFKEWTEQLQQEIDDIEELLKPINKLKINVCNS